MTYYLKQGNSYTISNKNDLDIHEKLPIGTYAVKFSDRTGFYLDAIEGFTLEGKVYGDTVKNVTRILNTFQTRPNSTGVLLSGEKGSGKTLLAKVLSIMGAKEDLLTIVINEEFRGDLFNQFMQNIDQPSIVIFDEFEKVYKNEKQEAILTLLDGTYSSKKLFIMTCNQKHLLNDNMINRPGRFFYSLDYKGLSEDFIRDYCTDNLKNKKEINSIVRYATTFKAFNFDMLKAVVEEMNRYNETLTQVLSLLNVNSDTIRHVYDVASFTPETPELTNIVSIENRVSGGGEINPLVHSVNIWTEVNLEYVKKAIKDHKKLIHVDEDDIDEDSNEDISMNVSFTPSDIKSFEPNKVIYHKTGLGTLEIKKAEIKSYSYKDYL